MTADQAKHISHSGEETSGVVESQRLVWIRKTI